MIESNRKDPSHTRMLHNSKCSAYKKNRGNIIIGILALFCLLLLGVNLLLLTGVIPIRQIQTEIAESERAFESAEKEKTRENTVTKKAPDTGTVQSTPESILAGEGRIPQAQCPLLREQASANRSASGHSGYLIFVFDDAGHSLEQLEYFLRLPFPCTIAVLPRLRYSAESARRIREAGKEVILHQPMQAINPHIDPGPGAIQPQHSSTEIKEIVRKNLTELWPVAGMNNHEGSLITADPVAVSAVLDIVAEKNIFFLDSRTTAKTVVPQAAKERNMLVWERAVFIDNEKNKKAMEEQIRKGLRIAQEKGYAIMIGHIACTELASLLGELYPLFSAQGFSCSTITQIAQKG